MDNFPIKLSNFLNNLNIWVQSTSVDILKITPPTILYNLFDDIDEYLIDIIIKDNLPNKFTDNIIKYNLINVIKKNTQLLFDDEFGSEYNKYMDDIEGLEYNEINGEIRMHISLSHEISNNNLSLSYSQGIKITKELLDNIYNSELSWDLPYTDRSIDNNKLDIYLNTLPNDRDRDIAKIIVENTKYITFDELKSTLIDQVNKLPDMINLYFDVTEKIGSEHWLIMVIWPYIKDKIYRVLNTWEDIEDNYPIVIIDDAMYSGQHNLKYINKIVYDYNLYDENNNIIEFGYIQNQIIKNKILNSNIALIVGYASDSSVYKLSIYNNNVYKNDDYNIYLYRGQITHNVYHYLKDYYTQDNKKEFVTYMNDIFNIWDTNTPIYFDHKIAGKHSSISFYNEIVKEQPSRKMIEKLEYIINNLK